MSIVSSKIAMTFDAPVWLVYLTIALYGVLAYMSWTESEQFKAAWETPAADPALLKALLLIFIELMLVTAIAIFFSTFSTPILSAALTFGLFVVGHFSADLRNFQDAVESPAAGRVAAALYWVLPNLAQFDVKAQVVHGQSVPAGYVAVAIAYAAAYIGLLLTISVIVFSRRDFK